MSTNKTSLLQELIYTILIWLAAAVGAFAIVSVILAILL